MTYYNNYYFVDDYAVSFPEIVKMYIEYTKTDFDEDEEEYKYTCFDEWLNEGMCVYITEKLPERIPHKYHLAAEIAGYFEEKNDFKHENEHDITFNERYLQIAYMIECEPRQLISMLERYSDEWLANDYIEEIKNMKGKK